MYCTSKLLTEEVSTLFNKLPDSSFQNFYFPVKVNAKQNFCSSKILHELLIVVPPGMGLAVHVEGKAEQLMVSPEAGVQVSSLEALLSRQPGGRVSQDR